MKLVEVSEKVFNEYIKKHKLNPKQGSLFHSTNYVNEKGEIKAYHESNSWSMVETYLVDPMLEINPEFPNRYNK